MLFIKVNKFPLFLMCVEFLSWIVLDFVKLFFFVSIDKILWFLFFNLLL